MFVTRGPKGKKEGGGLTLADADEDGAAGGTEGEKSVQQVASVRKRPPQKNPRRVSV